MGSENDQIDQGLLLFVINRLLISIIDHPNGAAVGYQQYLQVPPSKFNQTNNFHFLIFLISVLVLINSHQPPQYQIRIPRWFIMLLIQVLHLQSNNNLDSFLLTLPLLPKEMFQDLLEILQNSSLTLCSDSSFH